MSSSSDISMLPAISRPQCVNDSGAKWTAQSYTSQNYIPEGNLPNKACVNLRIHSLTH